MSTHPFTDPTLVHGPFYATTGRLAQRTSALHAAKIAGSDAASTIAGLAATGAPARATVVDLGCGRGTTTVRLSVRLPATHLIAVDASPALLATAYARLRRAGHHRADGLCANFHNLPFADGSLDIAVAAFCLYHSSHPTRVVAEIARCLRPGGRAILVTKSADSYHDLDRLVAGTGLDPDATGRPSLYSTFHSNNAAAITATALRVDHVLHEEHVFHFTDFDDLAGYLVTTPKYSLPAPLGDDPAVLAGELRRRIPERAVIARSTVTYLVAARP